MDVAILAGGGGTRLWPLSRGNRPKQFLLLPGDRTLLEQAVDRARALTTDDHIWIVTIAGQVSETQNNLPGFRTDRIIVEPQARNSGPAGCLATLLIESYRGEPTTVLLVPADHYIPDARRYAATMKKGIRRAEAGESLVTFGLHVAQPRTDFGYIEVENGRSKAAVRKVKRFVEKPDLARAKRYARSGKHYWNSGMFCWRSDFFRQEMAQHAPKIFHALDREGWQSFYPTLPDLSIDYALMEKSRHVDVVPASFKWSDLGTWAAVHDATSSNAKRNVVMGLGEVIDGKGNLIHAKDKPVVVFGVDDLIVIETPQVTLVTTRDKSRELKKLRAKTTIH